MSTQATITLSFVLNLMDEVHNEMEKKMGINDIYVFNSFGDLFLKERKECLEEMGIDPIRVNQYINFLIYSDNMDGLKLTEEDKNYFNDKIIELKSNGTPSSKIMKLLVNSVDQESLSRNAFASAAYLHMIR